jgi:hypothetical protein
MIGVVAADTPEINWYTGKYEPNAKRCWSSQPLMLVTSNRARILTPVPLDSFLKWAVKPVFDVG